MVSRSCPIMTRSRADSKSSIPMVEECRRTACSADSFTRFARSAPLMPGVPRATISSDTEGSSGLFFEWTSRIGKRSSKSGSGTTIWRSQQRRVQDVRSVGRRDDDDALRRVKAVHLVQHLVQHLLALVVAATQTGTA